MQELKTIRLNQNYKKLHGQTIARLVAVFTGVDGEEFLRKFPDLIGYDEKTVNGQRVYFMSNNQDYILLLFVGDKDIMFPTFRKNNKENAELYGESVGELFKIQIENP